MIQRPRINPKMMKWARTRAGFTNGYEDELPLDIKRRYKKWENGDATPTWNQLRNAGKKYGLPIAFFFMDNPPKEDNLPSLINYRKLNNNSIYNKMSPSLIKQIRRSEHRRSIFIDLCQELNEDITKFDVPKWGSEKKAFSRYLREKLDVSIETQKSWKKDENHYSFLNNWKEVITDKLGILIFESEEVEIEEMRGLCIFHSEIPVILLNGKDSPNGRIFTIFHELTHLLLGESAICGDDFNRDIETFCNSVAGEFLVPKNDLLKNYKQSPKKLSNNYGVSKQVIFRRLLDENIISKSDYKLNTLDTYVNYKSSESKGNYLYNMIKYNGKPYYSLVLDAYEYGIISSLEFSKYTNLGQNQIPKLQDILFGAKQ